MADPVCFRVRNRHGQRHRRVDRITPNRSSLDLTDRLDRVTRGDRCSRIALESRLADRSSDHRPQGFILGPPADPSGGRRDWQLLASQLARVGRNRPGPAARQSTSTLPIPDRLWAAGDHLDRRHHFQQQLDPSSQSTGGTKCIVPIRPLPDSRRLGLRYPRGKSVCQE